MGEGITRELKHLFVGRKEGFAAALLRNFCIRRGCSNVIRSTDSSLCDQLAAFNDEVDEDVGEEDEDDDATIFALEDCEEIGAQLKGNFKRHNDTDEATKKCNDSLPLSVVGFADHAFGLVLKNKLGRLVNVDGTISIVPIVRGTFDSMAFGAACFNCAVGRRSRRSNRDLALGWTSDRCRAQSAQAQSDDAVVRTPTLEAIEDL